jgi:putative phosphoribosyl transferase
MAARFRDRIDAGQQLAAKLRDYANRPDVLVLALPRGGVPVAFEVAQALNAPLDVFLVRKLGLPGHEELAMGAIASGNVVVRNSEVMDRLGIPERVIADVAAREQRELERRERAYRDDRSAPDVRGKTVLLVDDGLATGATMRAAAAALREQDPDRIVVAVPTAAPETCDDLREEVDDIICAITPEPFYAVGLWYDDFSQTSDDEVRDLLARARQAQPPPARERGGGVHMNRESGHHSDEHLIQITAGPVTLEGTLSVPADARGVVLFAHGSGSSRHSPRNRHVASVLQAGGLATVLIDLLTADEETVDLRTRQLRFDIDLLADRLVGATDWLAQYPDTCLLRVGYFGASTGGGAALVAAAQRPEVVGAVVSRGGRPDLAGQALPQVRAPTLLIVGGHDQPVIAMNQQALAQLRCEKRLEIVPRATHLFEEPGTLDQVARLARDWFNQHLVPAEVQRSVG